MSRGVKINSDFHPINFTYFIERIPLSNSPYSIGIIGNFIYLVNNS